MYLYPNDSTGGNIFGALIAVALAVIAILVLIGLLMYILKSIGLTKIAKKHDIKHGWFAWIPVLSTYLTGEIAFGTQLKAVVFLIANWAVGGIGAIISITNLNNSDLSWISMVFGIIAMVLSLIATYKIYKKMSKKATVMLVFTILTGGILAPIFLFAIRNNEIISET